MSNIGTGAQFDIIVEDGGHSMRQQQISLTFLFGYLKPGGLYFLEDLLTSFWNIPFFQDAYPTTVSELGHLSHYISGDTRMTLDSNQFGLLKIARQLEHMDCYNELCVFQRYNQRQLSLEFAEHAVVLQRSATVIDTIVMRSRFEKHSDSTDNGLVVGDSDLDLISRLCIKAYTHHCSKFTYHNAYAQYLPAFFGQFRSESPGSFSIILAGIWNCL